MIQPEFLLFELTAYALFAACLWHASRQGVTRVLELAFGVPYGVFLEWMTIQQLQAYTYGQFLVMFDGAPLTIGIGWAVIVYSAMAFTRRFAMPNYLRPVMNGLLALNIDLAMDAVAIRIGFWRWDNVPLDAEWFGVPWANFWAWFIVVSAYSAMLHFFRDQGWREHPVRRWLYVPLACLASVGILAAVNVFYAFTFSPVGLDILSMVVLIGANLILVIHARPRLAHTGGFDGIVFAVPLIFHLYFNLLGFTHGFYADVPAIGIVGVAMMVIGLGVHLWPVWAARTTRSARPA